MKKYILLGILSGFVILHGQVNTEAMRGEDNSDGFKNQFNLDLGYEKANSEVLDLATEYRLDYIRKDNFHSFMVINLENGFEKENNSPKNIITNKYRCNFFMMFTNYLFNFLDTNFSTSKSRIVPASTINLCPVLVKTICTCERTSSCEKKGSSFCS